MSDKPEHYQQLQTKYPALLNAAETLGKTAREAGPLSEKERQLVQLGASAALRSQGAVRSHARRALAAGATPEEVRHAVIVLTSTIGFPTVAAALDWLEKVMD
ncbi:MAG: carboxymuconolactone decarboxylase family protein [Desulfomicrobium sp.]|jgi:AhpD family alkylhydroperoxidase|nr:carboxymuconolactone decarboxylase family protein [Desulfomicrobium sp.]NLV96107.1 carboxymuconolactone decarboxylase family protein [Desulfovibrionales bacterium]